MTDCDCTLRGCPSCAAYRPMYVSRDGKWHACSGCTDHFSWAGYADEDFVEAN